MNDRNSPFRSLSSLDALSGVLWRQIYDLLRPLPNLLNPFKWQSLVILSWKGVTGTSIF